MSAPLSPVTLEVVRNGLYAIAEEMSVIVMRSARSPLLKEAGDLSSALTDAQGRLIAQGAPHFDFGRHHPKRRVKRLLRFECQEVLAWLRERRNGNGGASGGR